METILGFLSFLLLELPARAISLYPLVPVLVIGLVVAIIIFVLVRARRGRTKS